MTNQAKGLLITTLGVLFVVPDALFIRLIDADMLVIAFWRMGLASLVVLIWMLIRHGRGYPAKISAAAPYGYLYAFFAAFSAVLFVTAVSLTSVANTVFIIATLPVFAAIFSWFLIGERLSGRMILTLIGAMIGVGIIAYGSGIGAEGNIWGDLAAFVVAASFGLGITAARKAAPASMLPMIPLGYGGAAIGLGFFIDPFAVSPGDWGLILLHGGVFIAVSTCLLAIGPRFITSAEVGLLILLETLLAPLLVWAVIGEAPGQYALIGGAVLIATLLISNVVALRRVK